MLTLNIMLIFELIIFFLMFIDIISTAPSTITKSSKSTYTLYLTCDDTLKTLEVRDYDTNFLRKTVTLPSCTNSYTYNLTAIPGSKVILFCYNENGSAGGGGVVQDSYGTESFIWKSSDGYTLDSGNYEFRILNGMWYKLYKLTSSSPATTYGFYIILRNYYICYDTDSTVVVPTDASYEFSLENNIAYVGEEPWGVNTVFISGAENIVYADGDKSGQSVEIKKENPLDQKFKFTPNKYGLIDIVWAGYGEWEYNQGVYDECHYYIRVCYDTCSSCSTTKEATTSEHQCTKCKGNRYFKSGTTSCYSKDEIDNGYYYDSESGNWTTCYEKCKTCNSIGNANNNLCTSCISNSKYPYLLSNGNCVNDTKGYYYSEVSESYYPCYERCATCSKAGTESKHNCDTCAKDSSGKYYHFIYNQTGQCISESEKPENTILDENSNTYIKCGNGCAKCDSTKCLSCSSGFHFIYNQSGVCIREDEKPDNTYLDTQTDTYNACYSTCSSCTSPGSSAQNNCTDCAKYSNGSYQYHFVHDKSGQCISKTDADANDYLDTTDNTYHDCYETCATCSKAGTSANHNCDSCIQNYHFIYAVKGNCINETTAYNNYPYTYYNTSSNQYEKCYERCWRCFSSGNIKYHNCTECRPNYHLVYNFTGACLRPCAKPSDTYLDNDTNTYRKCYDNCATCDFGGNENNHNCTSCLKDSSDNYIYHFVSDKPGQCVVNPGDGYYINTTDNTFHNCYESCATCTTAGTKVQHNCKTCKSGYHWYYKEEGNCYNVKPNGTYLNEKTDTYEKCHANCFFCDYLGTDDDNKCTKCAYNYYFLYNHTGHCIYVGDRDKYCRHCYIDYTNGTFYPCHERCDRCSTKSSDSNEHKCTICLSQYHRIYNNPLQCVTSDEVEKNTYLNTTDDTYYPCYERCATCNTSGTFTAQNCKSCVSGYTYYSTSMNCMNENEKEGKYEEGGELKDCYQTCKKCSAGGTASSHNCDECQDGYHFNRTTKNCINTQPDKTYLDNSDNTYKDCYSKCQSCSQAGNDDAHNCDSCISGYHFIYTQQGMCVNSCDSCYLDENDYYEKCYSTCAKCTKGGNSTNHNCTKCIDNYHFIYNKTGQCISEFEKPDDTYYEEENDTYNKCYDTCSKCSGAGNSSYHNCVKCAPGYHWIYNQPTFCIPDKDKPNDTYYDEDDDTFKKCYERCSKCSKGGDVLNHNCDECAKDSNGQYIYHFTIDKEKQCINENETEHDYYVDNDTNTYRECHKNCYKCTQGGSDTNNNCVQCNTYYHFIYNQTGQCIKEENKPEDTYYDEDEDTYKKCYDKCKTCDKSGNSSSNNCTSCKPGYHFVYNVPGLCIPDSEKPNDTYLDNDTDTYEKCYDTCSKCSKGGNSINNNCDDCAKFNNGTYQYHFIYTKTGQCVPAEEKCSNCYYNEEDNTYEKCYETCSKCNYGGNSTNQNCSYCPDGYHFIHNQPGVCVPEGGQPDNTYLDEDNNTYYECYERCEKCTTGGNSTKHNCKMCAQYSNGSYIYHFIYNEDGQCITEEEKEHKCPECTLNEEDNTYEKCYERCEKCNRVGNNQRHYCTECLKKNGQYVYHFVYNNEGQCITEGEKPNNTYLNNETNTYEECYETCGACTELGNSTDNKCTICKKYDNGTFMYHFIYTKTGQCVDEKCPGCYLNETDNTYEECYETCGECVEKGTASNQKCSYCKKYENGTYIYHYWYKDKDKLNCYSDDKQPNHTYLDEENNTYYECYERCEKCYSAGNELHHHCSECAKYPNGTYKYHFLYNETGQCITEDDKPHDTDLNNETNTYEKCHDRCGSCYGYGTDSENMCSLCKYTYNNGKYNYSTHFYWYDIDKGNCYYDNEKPNNTYLNEENNTYTRCYLRCESCEYGGNENQHNCTACIRDDEGNIYLYWIEDKPGQCITNGEKPNNSYIENDTIHYCYETCGRCKERGTEKDNKCLDCLYDETLGKYITHFIYNTSNCVPDEKQPNRTYLDEDDNTYKECYERCESCYKHGTKEEMNCNGCIRDENGNIIYYPIREKPWQCVNIDDAPNNTYFDSDAEEYVTCYERCSKCNTTGNQFTHNCTDCLVNVYGKYIYHFIYNQSGQCVNKTDIDEDFYLDNNTNTYWPCYERCGSCSKEGDENNHNCDTCSKDDEGNYEYHFVYNHTGQCITEEEKPNGTVLNITDNTYGPCPPGYTFGNDTCHLLVSYDDYLDTLKNTSYVLDNINVNITNEEYGYSYMITNDTSSIDNISNTIKDIYNINDETGLLVGLVTTTDENGDSTTTVSRVFTDDGTELDIVNIDDDYITIELTFNGTDTLSPETAKYIHDYDNSYDVFDPNNKFYQDLCTSFQNEKGHDVIVEDRVKYYYTNYCGTCQYSGMNYDTNKMSCKCSVKGKVFDEKVNFTSTFPINIEIIKCTVESFKGKHVKKNASFFLVMGAVCGQGALLASFFLWGYPQLLNRIKNVANPPVKPGEERSDKKKITFKIEDKNDNSIGDNNHNPKNSDVLSLNNMSVEQSHFNNSMAAMNNTRISKMNYSFVTHKTNDIISTESPISVFKFAYIVSNTEKTYLAMFWEIFKEEYSLCRCIWRKSIFETYAFNFSFYIMYLTLLLMLNGLFIYYNIMHLIFLEKLTTFQYILSPILACISIQVILYFPKICIFSYPMFYSVYKKEKKPGEIHASINKLVKKVKQRMIIFFIIMWLVTLLNVFYLVCFCSIWYGTQPKLYYDFLISLLIFLILTIIIASIIAALRYYGFHNNNEKLLKIQKSLKDFFVFF